MTSRFERDTALIDNGDGSYEARIDEGWWIDRGPNGGYIAALIVRALTAAVGDPERVPRSLTIHYLAPPAAGPARLTPSVERAGRLLSFVSARLSQGDRLLATAQAVFGSRRDAPTFDDAVVPQVPGPEDLPIIERPAQAPELARRYDIRWALGPLPGTSGSEAEAGGWIRLVEPARADHALLAAICDGWIPPVFSRLSEMVAVPTIDLTVHFRAAEVPDDDWFLVRFTSRLSAEGFLEEDGEVWSRGGTLLAQSRQLALVLPVPG